jgi:hypothetical protein
LIPVLPSNIEHPVVYIISHYDVAKPLSSIEEFGDESLSLLGNLEVEDL